MELETNEVAPEIVKKYFEGKQKRSDYLKVGISRLNVFKILFRIASRPSQCTSWVVG